MFRNLRDHAAGACPPSDERRCITGVMSSRAGEACCHLIFDGNMNAQRGPGRPVPRLPSRSIPAPVYFGSWDVCEAGKARCPSVFEGHLVCACPALFAGKRGAAAAGWAVFFLSLPFRLHYHTENNYATIECASNLENRQQADRLILMGRLQILHANPPRKYPPDRSLPNLSVD